MSYKTKFPSPLTYSIILLMHSASIFEVKIYFKECITCILYLAIFSPITPTKYMKSYLEQLECAYVGISKLVPWLSYWSCRKNLSICHHLIVLLVFNQIYSSYLIIWNMKFTICYFTLSFKSIKKRTWLRIFPLIVF